MAPKSYRKISSQHYSADEVRRMLTVPDVEHTTQDDEREPESRRRFRIGGPLAVLFAGLLACGLIVGGGTAVALWSDNATTDSLTMQSAVVGFAVQKVGDTGHDVSTGPLLGEDGSVLTDESGAIQFDPAQFTIGPAEAQSIIGSNGKAVVGTDPSREGWAAAVPFTIATRTTAGYGMDFTFGAFEPQEGSVFDLATRGTPVFFPVESVAACTVPATLNAPKLYVPEDQVTAVAAGGAAQIVEQTWCMVIEIEPGTYENTATASYSDSANNLIAATDSWWAILIPDAASEPSLAITVTPSLTKGCVAP